MIDATGRPDESEFAPYAKQYVDLVPESDVLRVLAEQIERTTGLFNQLEEARAGEFRYGPGKWTAKEVLGHLADTERIFAYRALRIARGDQTPLPGFEQNDYVPASNAGERLLAGLLAEWQVVRQGTVMLLGSLTPEAWIRSGPVNNLRLTVRGIAFTLAGHELHHYRLLQERYLPAK